MTSDLLSLSVTGLRVSQSALSTVGHNIANAGTEGYSRQRVDPVTNPASRAAGGFIGNGVNVNSVERLVNPFIAKQIQTDSTLFNDLESFYNKISQVDNLLSDESTGLSSSLTAFFSAMHNGSDDPTSISARQLVISEASNLADRFNSIHNRLTDINISVEDDMEIAVAKINALSENIAQLNAKISNLSGNGGQPNDLLDKRDLALNELAALVPIQNFDQGNGLVNVVIGNGQALVVGVEARSLSLGAGVADSSKQDIIFNTGRRTEVVTNLIKGGELGGLVRVRDELMDSVFNGLGRVAIVLADTFNAQHATGIDLEGEFGEVFFHDVNEELVARSRVIANSGNPTASGQVMALYIRDSQNLGSSDYRVDIGSSGSVRITRSTDQAEVFNGLLSGEFPFSVEFDGMELNFEQGTYNAGDSFILRPLRSAGRDFSTAISSASDIAFASPLLTDASLGNLGSGKVSAGEVTSLVDSNGDALPLFAETGQMSPPLLVVFNTESSYDVLDNSDPGNPVHLDPPIRNQRYVPGVRNQLFSSDMNETMVSTRGEMIGLPDGRSAVSQAGLLPSAVPPDFTTTDFSGTADQFAFDLVVSNTLNGANDGTFTVTISSATIVDEDALLLSINSQLAATDIRAYIADSGALAFRLNTAGYGNISLQGYDADPDGNANNAPAGQANNLLGFDVEGSTFTTVGGADGVSGDGMLNNGYPAELISVFTPNANGIGSTETRVFSSLHGTAKALASELSNIQGVQANASTYAELSEVQLTYSAPLQLRLNGEDLLEYGVDATTGDPALSSVVPNPNADPDAFYDYVATQINNNSDFQAQGIYAVAGVDQITGARELRVFSSEGDDLQFGLISTAGDQLSISDGDNSDVTLSANGQGLRSQVVVGGKLDIALADGLRLSTLPSDSMLFGDTTASDFAQSTFLGIQADITGTPSAGDTFTLDFNHNASLDNRNALRLVNLETDKILNGNASLSQSYGVMVEEVAIQTSSSRINMEAADQVLQQTTNIRDSISGVNLDEEAADLIRYEQLFSANAQVISVARDVFDRLIGSF